jgi:hypothetical protein
MSISPSAVKSRAKGRSISVLTLMLITSVALNFGLAYKIRAFVSMQNRQMTRLAEQRLKIGTAVPAISARRPDRVGGSVETSRSQDDHPIVLYVFAPQCGWCEKNLASLKTLIAERGQQYRFIGLSLTAEGVAQHATDHNKDFQIEEFFGVKLPDIQLDEKPS